MTIQATCWGAALVAALANSAAGPASAADGELVLATTTSTENTGLLRHLHPDFEARTGIRVKVVAKGTGASLQMARDGNADVILVHARPLEDAFVAEGYGVMRRDVMTNHFLLVGPPGDPAQVRQTKSIIEAFRSLAAGRGQFVSRGDDSGTHIKEQEIWRATGMPLETKTTRAIVAGQPREFTAVRPRGDWYLSIGQGMGKTLILTSEKQAYTLSDRATYNAFAFAAPPKTDLIVVGEGDPMLFNPYSVIAVNPRKRPHVNFPGAEKYIAWITSPEVQRRIGDFHVGGKTLFFPNAAGQP